MPELPFDEEHKLSLSVCGADDAFRLEVSAQAGGGVFLRVIWLRVALHGESLLLRLHAGLQRQRQGQKEKALEETTKTTSARGESRAGEASSLCMPI